MSQLFWGLVAAGTHGPSTLRAWCINSWPGVAIPCGFGLWLCPPQWWQEGTPPPTCSMSSSLVDWWRMTCGPWHQTGSATSRRVKGPAALGEVA
eukprot:COSAG04_NODE_794_length_10264_cov_35.102804_8_plen_94_part_00